MKADKYIIIGNQIAGPIEEGHEAHNDLYRAIKKYSLPRYDIPPSLQKEWEGRTEVTERVDFIFGKEYQVCMNDKVYWIPEEGFLPTPESVYRLVVVGIPQPSGSPKQGIEELKAITSGYWDQFNTNEEINEELGRDNLELLKEGIEALISQKRQLEERLQETMRTSAEISQAKDNEIEQLREKNAAIKEKFTHQELLVDSLRDLKDEYLRETIQLKEENAALKNENDELRKPGGNEMWINQNVVQPQKEKIKELESSLFVMKARLASIHNQEVYEIVSVESKEKPFVPLGRDSIQIICTDQNGDLFEGYYNKPLFQFPPLATGWLKKINLKDLPVQQNDAVAFVKWCFENYTLRGMEWVRKEDAEKTIVQTFTTEDLYNIFKQKP